MSSNCQYFYLTHEMDALYSSILSDGTCAKPCRCDSLEVKDSINLRNKSATAINIKIMINSPPEHSMAERHRS